MMLMSTELRTLGDTVITIIVAQVRKSETEDTVHLYIMTLVKLGLTLALLE